MTNLCKLKIRKTSTSTTVVSQLFILLFKYEMEDLANIILLLIVIVVNRVLVLDSLTYSRNEILMTTATTT